MTIRFDAVGDYLDRSSGTVVDYAGNFTLMAEVELVVDLNNYSTILVVSDAGNSVYDILGTDLDGTTLRLGTHALGQTGTVLSVGTRYHVALVRDSALTTKAYLNGVLDASLGTDSTTTRAACTRNGIGGFFGVAEGLNGRVGRVKAWSVALTAAEIQQEMATIRPQRTANLVYWLPTFPGAGERARDYSGNGRNFTENGTLADEQEAPTSWGARVVTPQKSASTGLTTATLSGPTVLAVGSGRAYTVTLDAPAASTVTVTWAATGSGSWTSGTTTTITAGNTTSSNTFTPSATGATSISTTNNAGLTNAGTPIAATAYTAATTYTLTTGATGSVGVAQAVTAALPANRVVATSVVVTVTPSPDGSMAGTITLPAYTVAGSASANYTPASTGTKTLTPTNGGGLTNPSAASTNVTTAAAWLSLDPDTVGGNDGALVSSWTDAGGNSPTQATATLRPFLAKQAVNGHNGLAFVTKTGRLGYLTTPNSFDSTWNTSLAFRAVVTLPDVAGTWTIADAGSGSFTVRAVTGDGPVGQIQVAAAGLSVTSAILSVPVYVRTVVVGVYYDGSKLVVSANGLENTLLNYATNLVSGNLGLSGPLRIGARNDGSAGFNGLVHDVYCDKATPSRAAWQAAEIALRAKYGVTPVPTEILLGDSTTYGQGLGDNPNQNPAAQMADLLGKFRYVNNQGVGGSTAQDWIDTHLQGRVLNFLLPDRQTVVNVQVGGNDAPAGNDYTIVRDRLIAICASIRSTGGPSGGTGKVVLSTLEQRGSGIAWYDNLNAWIRANWSTYADALADVTTSPVFGATAAGATAQTADTTIYQDGVHPTALGYTYKAIVWADAADAIPLPGTTGPSGGGASRSGALSRSR